ncbi:MAG: hypothetical protein K9K63_18835 [Desulfotignum sp.]|nr:hypothetical protein [Desulfotignum sp.]MCF8139357.1 hypothetical protein [Desulfotignum sp.]
MKRKIVVIPLLTLVAMFIGINQTCLADMVKLHSDGEVWIYDDLGNKKKMLLGASNKQNKQLQVQSDEIFIKTKTGQVRVYSLDGNLIRSYFAPNNPNANWVK